MHKDFWHQRWTENKIGFHLDEVNPYLPVYFPQLQLSAGARVFVPLAGKTLDILWLLEQGYAVDAIELSELAVETFFREQAITPEISHWPHGRLYEADGLRFWAGDVFTLEPDQLGEVDAVYDRAALIALPDTMRESYVQHLLKLTGPVPQMLVTLEYNQHEMPGPPFGVLEDEVQRLYSSNYQQIEPIIRHDVLPQHGHFAARGLTSLFECVYLLQVPKK